LILSPPSFKNILQPINYFEDTIGRSTQRKERRNSIFSIQMWNCYEATKH
jgi:hypothetical protein